ncbi:hypothetical protein TCAL_15183 [Tigriopus californicus]|uniref:AIG1-type G domain-containing protein n=1 Tax=Tigriopus californicus TaxID=6832 RepID=A0A553NDP2_TIGCA|nr:uncharacterized protein LOC131889125 [Tigriopus californicus]TRY63572.1 hypothetical protein TCAL_15183 [Tigriopus californicus]
MANFRASRRAFTFHRYLGVCGSIGALGCWGHQSIKSEAGPEPGTPTHQPDEAPNSCPSPNQGQRRPSDFKPGPLLSAIQLENPQIFEHAQLPKKEKDSETIQDECIIVVGTTGTGKSSTIAKFTGQDVQVSRRAESVTRACQVFADLKDPTGPKWVDTVGYDDSTHLTDEESFQDVLKFIDQHDMKKVRAIVWTVMSQERNDARLQRQADFINQFKPGEIWRNVIILVKHPGSFNPQLACQGALVAAKAHANDETQIKAVGYTYLDDALPTKLRQSVSHLSKKARSEMLLVSDDEVRQILEEQISTIENPIPIIFRDHQCLSCGEVNDRRLLPPYCHLEPLMKHPLPARMFHPEACEIYHSLGKETFHSGLLRIVGGPQEECEMIKRGLSVAAIPLMCMDPFITGPTTVAAAASAWYACSKLSQPVEERFSCCNAAQTTSGCKIRWRCCRNNEENEGCMFRFKCCRSPHDSGGCMIKYMCCGQQQGTAGCVQVCRKCDAPWGSPANKCVLKEHTLVRFEPKGGAGLGESGQ